MLVMEATDGEKIGEIVNQFLLLRVVPSARRHVRKRDRKRARSACSGLFRAALSSWVLRHERLKKKATFWVK